MAGLTPKGRTACEKSGRYGRGDRADDNSTQIKETMRYVPCEKDGVSGMAIKRRQDRCVTQIYDCVTTTRPVLACARLNRLLHFLNKIRATKILDLR